jgi:uncharacterized protein YfkK (UPF0435 family)
MVEIESVCGEEIREKWMNELHDSVMHRRRCFASSEMQGFAAERT